MHIYRSTCEGFWDQSNHLPPGWTVSLFPQGDTKGRDALSSSQYVFLVFYISSSLPPCHFGICFHYLQGTLVRGFDLFVFSCTVLHLSRGTDRCCCVSSLPSRYLLKITKSASKRTYKFPGLSKIHTVLVLIMCMGVRTCVCERHWIL